MLIILTGITGLLLILFAFIANEFNFLARKSYSYNIINLFGAFFLGVYAFRLGNEIFVALEIVWGAVATYFIFKIWYHKDQKKK